MNNSNRNREFWESALKLADAPFAFASEYQRSRLRNTEDKSGYDGRYFEMKMDLQYKLSTAELVAVGFYVSENLKNEPIIIPQHLFEREICEIDWKRGQVKALGKTFELVRVAKPDMALDYSSNDDEQVSNGRTNSANRKRPGPKTSFDSVCEMYSRLNDLGSFQGLNTNKSIAAKIISELEKDKIRFPMGRGLKASTVARHLKKILSETIR